jgi:hypothetical protein
MRQTQHPLRNSEDNKWLTTTHLCGVIEPTDMGKPAKTESKMECGIAPCWWCSCVLAAKQMMTLTQPICAVPDTGTLFHFHPQISTHKLTYLAILYSV